MERTPIIHKQGKEYAVTKRFGQYTKAPSPLCVGAKMLWQGRSYWLHRNWKYVTCKHCLRIKAIKDTNIKEA